MISDRPRICLKSTAPAWNNWAEAFYHSWYLFFKRWQVKEWWSDFSRDPVGPVGTAKLKANGLLVLCAGGLTTDRVFSLSQLCTQYSREFNWNQLAASKSGQSMLGCSVHRDFYEVLLVMLCSKYVFLSQQTLKTDRERERNGYQECKGGWDHMRTSVHLSGHTKNSTTARSVTFANISVRRPTWHLVAFECRGKICDSTHEQLRRAKVKHELATKKDSEGFWCPVCTNPAANARISFESRI